MVLSFRFHIIEKRHAECVKHFTQESYRTILCQHAEVVRFFINSLIGINYVKIKV